MKRRIQSILFLSLVISVFLLSSCSSTAKVEQPVVPVQEAISTPEQETESEIVAPVAAVEDVATETVMAIAMPLGDQRYVRTIPVQRYGDRLVVTNRTGYPLVSFDLFNDLMYLSDDASVNLLGEEVLEDQASRVILLADHPALKEAIESKGESDFILNAKDSDGDMYFRTWKAQSDPWNIIITFDDHDYEYSRPVPPSQGDHVDIVNATGYALQDLFLEEPTNSQGQQPVDLLGTSLFPAGSTVRIQTADMPWIAEQLPFDVYGKVLVTAQDTDGDYYRKTWYPTTDIWRIDLTLEDLDRSSPHSPKMTGERQLFLSNESSIDIWYLHVVTEEMLADERFGDDLLGMDILDQADTMWIDLSTHEQIGQYLDAGRSEPLYLVAFDLMDNLYRMSWTPSVDGWNVVLTDESLVSQPLPEAVFGSSVLRVDNQTGEDIWYLHLSTAQMYVSGNNGSDVLEDDILYAGDTFHLIPESYRWVLQSFTDDPTAPIHVVAYTDDGTVYHRNWSPVRDGWVIELTAEDLREE